MAIDFPNSPSLDQVFTVGSRSWKWTGTVWQTVTTQVGSQGDKGGLKYNFSTNTIMSEPAQGIIRFNNSTIADVTLIAVDNATAQGTDVSDYFVNLATSLPSELSVIKYYMIIQSNSNPDATYCIFAVNGVTDNTGWLQLDVDYVSGSLPSENEDLVISLSRVGDLGPTGPETSITLGTIDTGLPGSTAAAAITGPPGDQVLSLTIPQGPTGPETSISLGTIDTGLPGSTAAAAITGPAGDQILSLTIPQGPTGPGGVYQYSVTGPTAPTLINGEPVAEGDTWFNSETGRFYIYYDGYWVENTSSLVGATGLGYDNITSASSNSIPTTASSRTFLLNQTGALVVGSFVLIVDAANTANWMFGQISSINYSTRNMVVSVTDWAGTGTITSWTISVSGRRGPTGPANTLSIGTVTDGNPNTTAAASITGAAPNQTLNLTLKQGPTGPQGDPTLSVTTPTITANAYTIQLTDASDFLQINNGATACTVFIPTDASVNFPVGTQINIAQISSGQVTIAAVTPGTTTVNATPGLKLRAQWSGATLVKRAANTWWVTGDLSA